MVMNPVRMKENNSLFKFPLPLPCPWCNTERSLHAAFHFKLLN